MGDLLPYREDTRRGDDGRRRTCSHEEVTGRNYEKSALKAAYAVGVMAPPLWEEWFEFACTFFEDIKEVFTTPGKEDSTIVVMESLMREFANLIEQVTEPETECLQTVGHIRKL